MWENHLEDLLKKKIFWASLLKFMIEQPRGLALEFECIKISLVKLMLLVWDYTLRTIGHVFNKTPVFFP